MNTENPQTLTAMASDGVPLSCVMSGSGPPLVMVHGTGDDHRRFNRVRDALGEKFTLYLVNRRGRGESGDTDGYSFGLDIDDIGCVLKAIDGPVNLFGHSAGAVCALEACQRSDNVQRLMLYEPPLPTPETDPLSGVVQAVSRLIEEGVVVTYLRDFFGTPPDVIERQRNHPVNWPLWLGMAHTIPRELVGLRQHVFDDAKFSDLDIPVRILVGGNTRARLVQHSHRVQAALPNCDIVELPDQGHIGMTTAPEMFAKAVLEFFAD